MDYLDYREIMNNTNSKTGSDELQSFKFYFEEMPKNGITQKVQTIFNRSVERLKLLTR